MDQNNSNTFNRIDNEDYTPINHDHTARLIQSTKILENSNQTLEQASRILDETEQIGIDTALTLQKQGKNMRDTYGELHNINHEIRKGGKIIGKMWRRGIISKIIFIATILFLFVIFGLILFFIFYKIFKGDIN